MSKKLSKNYFYYLDTQFLWLFSPVSVLWNSFSGYFTRFCCERGKRSLTTCDAMNFMTDILRLSLIVRAQVTIDNFLSRSLWLFIWIFITCLIFDVEIIKIKINIDKVTQINNIKTMMVIIIIINPLNLSFFLITTWTVKILQ